MSTITIASYQPEPRLDQELAILGYTAAHGWPDQRPITPTLVRSRLRPPTHETPTLLATCRDTTGRLVGAAAVRPPADPTRPGRLWGPVVHPDHQRHGLGHRLLATATRTSTTPLVTAEIPASRTAACRFFTSAGWQLAGEAFLLKRALPIPTPNVEIDPCLHLRAARPGEQLHHELAHLIARTAPERAGSDATGAYTRWTTDERFTPGCLQLAWRHHHLVGAALVYPLRHTEPDEPTEALLAELLVQPDTAEPEHLSAVLAAGALNAAAATGARIARSIQADRAGLAVLGQHVVSQVDTICYYRQRG